MPGATVPPRGRLLAMHRGIILGLFAAGRLQVNPERVIGFDTIGQALADRKARSRVVAVF